MIEQSLSTILIVAGAWVALELLKYVFSRTLEAATKNKRKGGNPSNSVMSAGELRDNFRDVKEVLGKIHDAAEGARSYAKRTFDEVKR